FVFYYKCSAFVVCVNLISCVCHAADLGSAKVTAVKNIVTFKSSSESKDADVGQRVVEGECVMTRDSSLAEITADDSSIIRIGAHSVFSYSSKERIVKLDKGTMLMHTPPGNGGATIESGGVTGAISGTTFMLTASPAKCPQCGKELRVNDAGKVICRDHPNTPPSNGGFALIVLEGSSVTKVTGPDGQMVAVAPGQMAVVGPKGSGAPAVYAVNLTQIARTSPLINAFPTPLPSLPQIIATAYQLQGQNLQSTGTSGVAISSSGQLLTAASPPPNPFLQTFAMASNQPGQNNSSNIGNLANIATAAGGGGSPTPTGVAPTGGGAGAGPTIPAPPNTPPSQGQNAVAANQSTAIVPLTVSYDGTSAGSIVGARLSGAVSSGVALANETTGILASKNVGTWSVTTSMGLVGANVSRYTLTQPTLTGTITAKDLNVFGAAVTTKVYDGTTAAVVTGSVLVGNSTAASDGKFIGAETVTLNGATSGTFASKNVGTGKGVTTTMTLGGADAG
ncbi:hypothetical protein EBT11_09200, partial [bacterium]|nr:hypothetical protein [bacterium]